MANRSRPYQIKFCVSEEEKALIESRMKSVGVKNKGAFIRKMIIDGCYYNLDLSSLKEVTVSMNRIGNNINQITRKINQNGNATNDDLEKINERVNEIWHILKSTLSNLQ